MRVSNIKKCKGKWKNNTRLECITNMRSNDCIFGIFNDLPWFEYVYNDIYRKLRTTKYKNLEKGNLIYLANSFHCYERHFGVLEKIAEENEKSLEK